MHVRLPVWLFYHTEGQFGLSGIHVRLLVPVLELVLVTSTSINTLGTIDSTIPSVRGGFCGMLGYMSLCACGVTILKFRVDGWVFVEWSNCQTLSSESACVGSIVEYKSDLLHVVYHTEGHCGLVV